MSYYVRAWVKNGAVVAVYSREHPFSEDISAVDHDTRFDIIMSGDYVDSGTLMGTLDVSGDAPSVAEPLVIEAFEDVGQGLLPEPGPIRTPHTVTRRQAKQQLLIDGILDQVQPAIDAIADDIQRAMVQIYWDDATEFERANGELIALATSLGLDDEAVDALFIAASQR